MPKIIWYRERWYQINLYVERKTNTIKRIIRVRMGYPHYGNKVTKKYTPEYVKNPVYLLHGNTEKKIKKINKETKLTKAIW